MQKEHLNICCNYPNGHVPTVQSVILVALHSSNGVLNKGLQFNAAVRLSGYRRQQAV
jgi:hypothetical protein